MTDKERITIDQQVVPQLAEVAGVMTAMLGRLMDTHESQAAFGKDVEYLREELCTARDAITKIAQVLHEGNGQKPLVSRVAVLEEKVDDIEEDNKLRGEAELISRKGKYALAAALTTGLLGFATALISLLS